MFLNHFTLQLQANTNRINNFTQSNTKGIIKKFTKTYIHIINDYFVTLLMTLVPE